MKKWIKWLIVLGVLLFVVLPLTLLIVAWIFIDPIGQKLIEVGGTQALGVKTQVGNFHCSILGGSVAIRNMTIDNPSGFDPAQKTFSMGTVSTGVSLGSLSSDTIEISELVIEHLKLHIESNEKTTNVQAIMANVNAGGSSAAPAADPAKPAAASAGPEKKFKVALIRLKNIGMDVHATWPADYKASFTIPPFEMHDIWKKDGSGYTSGELITEILNRTTKAGLEVGGKGLQDQIKARLMAELDKAGDKIKNAVQAEVNKATKDLTKDAQKALTDGAKDATKDAGKDLKNDLKKALPFK